MNKKEKKVLLIQIPVLILIDQIIKIFMITSNTQKISTNRMGDRVRAKCDIRQ